MRAAFFGLMLVIGMNVAARGEERNLFQNPDFTQRTSDGKPANYDLNGNVEYRYLGDPAHDTTGWGAALQSLSTTGGDTSGSVAQTVNGIDSAKGRWFRFTFRGLPQKNFAVQDGDLYMRVEFFGQGGKVSYDAKAKEIYDQVETARRDLSVNGVNRVGGAEVWQTYELEFMLPFPQVDQLRLSVGFEKGAPTGKIITEFFVTDFNLTRIDEPAGTPHPEASSAVVPSGQLIPIGGRWFYAAGDNETEVPRLFNTSNIDRLLYHDNIYSAPFAGNTTAVLRAGDLDLNGNVVRIDQLLDDNVTITFDSTSMIIHSHNIPNHPTGKFPAEGFGGNPNSIQEQNETFYIPFNPQPNPRHFVTTTDNSNHALPMGPIGIAINGVVFFNPFDMGNQDATNLMDRCCGHPNQDGVYHYHKYPICINSPWADEGKAHSPLIGWAFDGYPVYGPYESANVMAKDVTGDHALNAFNMHYDPERGWHYHVTPGRFPYIIGGYWGTEDSRDRQMPPGRGGPGFGPPPGELMRDRGPN
ncbi:MAG: YHYH protein [Tepidisphaeraceae bacterium]|jgi:hypothetical protein